ncbi:MAG: TrkA family potassium uptake protein [Myxococcales bacterium]|nr:TrkA family potassium uptake protein [Myxococcales bacterium]
MAKFAVIGLGTFGTEVALDLASHGHDVIAIDTDEGRLEAVRDVVSGAVVANAADREILAQLGVGEVQAAVIGLSEAYFAEAILTTLYLRELGVEKIHVKALNRDHGRALLKVGATHIIHPEEEVGRRLADRLANPRVIDQISFPEGYSIVEVIVPADLVGKDLVEADLRRRFGITIIVIKRGFETADPADDRVLIVPGPTERLVEGDHIVCVGEDANVEKFKKLA